MNLILMQGYFSQNFHLKIGKFKKRRSLKKQITCHHLRLQHTIKRLTKGVLLMQQNEEILNLNRKIIISSPIDSNVAEQVVSQIMNINEFDNQMSVVSTY